MFSSKRRLQLHDLNEIFEPGCRSLRSTEEVSVRFINNSLDVADICWVDFEGKIVRYLKLGARETVKIVTYIGHCWLARYTRNGAPAYFYPNFSKIYVAVRPHYAPTALCFIIQKVPTLYEATIEYFGELCFGREQIIQKLDLPNTVKFDISLYTFRKRVYQTAVFLVPLKIANQHLNLIYARTRNQYEVSPEEFGHHVVASDSEDPEQLAEAFANGQVDLCLQTVSDLSIECSNFKISEIFLMQIKKEFVMMGFSTVHSYAKQWINFILQNTSGIRNHCLLLKQLIYSTDLLQNKQLQELLQKNLPQVYRHLCFTKHHHVASVIAEVTFSLIALLAAYSDDYDQNALHDIWMQLADSQEAIKSAHFNLCNVLVMISLSYDCTRHMRVFLKSLSNEIVEESDDLLLSPKKQLIRLLEMNLGAVFSHCPPKRCKQLWNILIDFHLKNSNLNHLVQKLFSRPELISTYTSVVLKQFFLCLLSNLSMVFNQHFPQQKEIIEWLENSSEEILSTPARDVEEEKNIWKCMMSSLVAVSTGVAFSDNRFNQIIQTFCGEKFSLEALPISIRVAIFCALIPIIGFVSSKSFNRVLESISAIMTSEQKLFRCLLCECKEKVLKKYVIILLRTGYTYSKSKIAHVVVKEFLISSKSFDVFVVKSDAVLKESMGQSSHKRQYFYLKPLCDVLCEICCQISKKETDKLQIYVAKIFRYLQEIVFPVDCLNASKMALFELALQLLQILHCRDRKGDSEENGAESGENIAEHLEIVDQFCKSLCTHPEKYIETGMKSEQFTQLLKAAMIWMIKRGRTECVISWKYAKNFGLYDEATMEIVISSASVEMLENLLHSESGNIHAMKKLALYSMLAKHADEKKRKLLCGIVGNVLMVIADVVETDYLAALSLLRHIISIANGSAQEKDCVSFALTILSLKSEFLASEPDVLCDSIFLLLDCLRFGAHTVISDQCSLYADLFISSVKAVRKYANDTALVDPQYVRYLTYGLAKIAHSMLKHKRSFSRIAPFIISECLEDSKCISLALFRIFSMCDRYSIALLTTNLPPLQKARFAHLCPFFTKINKIVV